MSFHEYSERFGLHGKNLWTVIAEVGEKDKALAKKLANEYDGILEAMKDILDCWSKHLEH